MWNFVHYEPWEGRQYSKGYLQGVRLLALGDSHYGDDRGCATAYWLSHHIYRDRLPFWNGIESIVVGRPLEMTAEREHFWDSVAFANIFQSSMDKPGDEPTSQQRDMASGAFAEMVSALQPDLVLVFSKRGWECLPGEEKYPGSRNLDELRAPASLKSVPYLFATPAKPIIAAPINHPRNPVAPFKLWHDWVTQLTIAAHQLQSTATT